MKFGKDHKAILSTLEGDEVEAYINFLTREKIRHQQAIDDSGEAIAHFADDKTVWARTVVKLEQSAIRRHEHDINQAEERIRKTRELQKLQGGLSQL